MIKWPAKRAAYLTLAGQRRSFPLYTFADLLHDLDAYPCDEYHLWVVKLKPNAVAITRELIIEFALGGNNQWSSPMIFIVPFPGIGIVTLNHGARWWTSNPLHWSHSGDAAWTPRRSTLRRVTYRGPDIGWLRADRQQLVTVERSR